MSDGAGAVGRAGTPNWKEKISNVEEYKKTFPIWILEPTAHRWTHQKDPDAIGMQFHVPGGWVQGGHWSHSAQGCASIIPLDTAPRRDQTPVYGTPWRDQPSGD